MLRRDKLRVILVGALAFMTLFWLLGKMGGGNEGAVSLPNVEIGSGPPVVVVTVMDPKAEPEWAARIKKNREDYAKKHGMYPSAIKHH
jgi:mannan polymerase II complex MNN11 subunit